MYYGFNFKKREIRFLFLIFILFDVLAKVFYLITFMSVFIFSDGS